MPAQRLAFFIMQLLCGDLVLSLQRPLVMGVVNVTPDSFSDGGRYLQRDLALAQADLLLQQGADILDIGGESTRPGAEPVSLQQELDRVIPVIEKLRDYPVPVSIDSFKPEVMAEAIQAGARMVNDINALQEPKALQLVMQHSVAICLMHKQGTPQTMQQQPHYQDVVSEVLAFLNVRLQTLMQAGVARERLVIDPGFGFGKTLSHNLALLAQLAKFKSSGVAVLAGLSRKSMLGAITGRDIAERMPASVAAALLAVQQGADIVRVHDVAETVDAIKVWQAVKDFSNENV